MHIVLVTHHYFPEVGAPQRRWQNLSERFVAAGHRVTVLAPSPHYPSGHAGELIEDLRPGSVGVGPGGEAIRRLRFRDHGTDLRSRTWDQLVAAQDAVRTGSRTLRGAQTRPDVVIATAPGIPSIGAGFALSRLLRVPLVVEMRDAWPDLIAPSGIWGGTTRRGWRGAATTATHRLVTGGQRHAAAVVTTTASFAEVLRERQMRRVDVVRNGVELDTVRFLEPPPRRRETLNVLYLGTMGRSQALLTAVRASTVLASRGVPIRVRMVGSGFEDALLAAEARRLRAPVEFLGRIPRSEVEAQYGWADTVHVSLRAWDPFAWTVPSKLYEAMATGRHLSASLTGEAARVIREGGAGDVVPPECPAALADLWDDLANDRERLQIGASGRDWVTEHANFDRLAAHYLELLDLVVR